MYMKPHMAGWLLKVSTLTTALLALAVTAEEPASQSSSVPTPPIGDTKSDNSAKLVTGEAKASAEKPVAKPAMSKGIQEILKMVDAGVSKEVIKVYVEAASVAYNPNGADMIALKEHGVPDEVTIALLKRSAALRQMMTPAGARPGSSGYGPNPDVRFGPDAESYDYFQRYYLYPRTLAAANERLGYYGMPHFPVYY
jgi:hypothetical protein